MSIPDASIIRCSGHEIAPQIRRFTPRDLNWFALSIIVLPVQRNRSSLYNTFFPDLDNEQAIRVIKNQSYVLPANRNG